MKVALIIGKSAGENVGSKLRGIKDNLEVDAFEGVGDFINFALRRATIYDRIVILSNRLNTQTQSDLYNYWSSTSKETQVVFLGRQDDSMSAKSFLNTFTTPVAAAMLVSSTSVSVLADSVFNLPTDLNNKYGLKDFLKTDVDEDVYDPDAGKAPEPVQQPQQAQQQAPNANAPREKRSLFGAVFGGKKKKDKGQTQQNNQQPIQNGQMPMQNGQMSNGQMPNGQMSNGFNQQNGFGQPPMQNGQMPMQNGQMQSGFDQSQQNGFGQPNGFGQSQPMQNGFSQPQPMQNGFSQQQTGFEQQQGDFSQQQSNGVPQMQETTQQAPLLGDFGQMPAQNMFGNMQNGFGTMPSDSGQYQGGFEQQQSGFSQPQEDFYQQQGGFSQPQDGFTQSQGGFESSQGGFESSQGGFEQQNGFSQPQMQGGFKQAQPIGGTDAPMQSGFTQQTPSPESHPAQNDRVSRILEAKKRREAAQAKAMEAQHHEEVQEDIPSVPAPEEVVPEQEAQIPQVVEQVEQDFVEAPNITDTYEESFEDTGFSTGSQDLGLGAMAPMGVQPLPSEISGVMQPDTGMVSSPFPSQRQNSQFNQQSASLVDDSESWSFGNMETPQTQTQEQPMEVDETFSGVSQNFQQPEQQMPQDTEEVVDDLSGLAVGASDAEYQQNTSQPKVVVKEVVREVVRPGSTGTGTYKNVTSGRVKKTVLVTGDRGSGVTSTAFTLAQALAKHIDVLYFDADINRHGILNYIDYGNFCNYDNTQTSGIKFCKSSKAFDMCVIPWDNNLHLLGSNFDCELSDEELQNCQEVVAERQTDYGVTIIDCPVEKLHCMSDLALNAQLVVCCEASKRGFMNMICEFERSTLPMRHKRGLASRGVMLLTKVSGNTDVKKLYKAMRAVYEPEEVDWLGLQMTTFNGQFNDKLINSILEG